jgi:hypothetical protein
VDAVIVDPTLAPAIDTSSAAWTTFGPFTEGHLLLRLGEARKGPVAPLAEPPPHRPELQELLPRRWQVRSTGEGEQLALDDDHGTAWTTRREQVKGDNYQVRFRETEGVVRVSIAVLDPYEFPVNVEVEGKVGAEWRRLAVDTGAAYDHLLWLLLNDPKNARLDLDFTPQRLRGVRVRVSRGDAFNMPWTMAELRVYRQR